MFHAVTFPVHSSLERCLVSFLHKTSTQPKHKPQKEQTKDFHQTEKDTFQDISSNLFDDDSLMDTIFRVGNERYSRRDADNTQPIEPSEESISQPKKIVRIPDVSPDAFMAPGHP